MALLISPHWGGGGGSYDGTVFLFFLVPDNIHLLYEYDFGARHACLFVCEGKIGAYCGASWKSCYCRDAGNCGTALMAG